MLKAIEFATIAHNGVNRKYHDNIPYVAHVIRVTNRVVNYFEKFPSAQKYYAHRRIMLCVAPLHDVKEDTKFDLNIIEENLGKDVVEGINYLTNRSSFFPQLHRKERKQIDRDHLSKIPNHFKIIKLFDRIDNIYDLAKAKKDFITLYLDETFKLMDVLRDADPAVTAVLNKACAWLSSQSDIPFHREPVSQDNW